MREIAECLMGALNMGRDMVLVTVTGGKGSAPRHAGSQMLVDADGLACGTIGGGVLEAHAIARAQALLGSGKGCFEYLGLEANLGMACGGDSDLLYASVRGSDDSWKQVVAEALRCMDGRIPASFAFHCPEGEEAFEASVALVGADGALLAGNRDAAHGGFASIDALHFEGGWCIVPLDIAVRAVVFGAGHVGRATVDALSRVGFFCTVFDCRPEFACAEEIPAAHEVVCGDYANIAATLTLDERDFILIMTHSHRTDFAVLEQVLRQPHAYVGLMGSRRKIAAARTHVLEAGVSQAAIDSVHMPIGLPIEAETPEEIAVSIAAECILERTKHRA